MTRRSRRAAHVTLALVVLAGGCAPPTAVPSVTPVSSPSGPTPAETSATGSAPTSPGATGSATVEEGACPYAPGNPVAVMPEKVLHPSPPETRPAASPPSASAVDAAATTRQLGVLDGVAEAVTDAYIDPTFNGRDWPAIVARYRAIVAGGLNPDDFYVAMKLLVAELGDEHSRFQSPDDRRAEQQEVAGQLDYVGIGVSVAPLLDAGGGVIILTFPDSPAARAGLQPHDLVLAIDGQPIFDSEDKPTLPRLRGPAGSEITLTVQRPGETARDVTMTRARVEGGLPVGSCLITAPRVGYIFLPSLLDESIPGQVEAALGTLTSDGPLAGLIIDNRLDSGGRSEILRRLLELFMDGGAGAFQSREASRRFDIAGHDVGGSQTVPLVVLVSRETVSFGEVMSGVLQARGRAIVIGETSLGNVESLSAFDFDDGSRAWLAHETFIPDNAAYGPWEDTGIRPDITVPTRWDLFTAANDPALPAAIEALGLH